MQKVEKSWAQLKSFVSSLSTRKKVMLGIAVVASIQIVGYAVTRIARRKTPTTVTVANSSKNTIIKHEERDYRRNKLLQASQNSTSHQQESPIFGRETEVVNIFLAKLRADEVLSAYFADKSQLQQGSKFAKIFQQYMTVTMGGLNVLDKEVHLRETHAHLNIPKEHFVRFVNLWKESEKQLAIQGKDIWEEFQSDIIA